ncbi:Uncharacterised protein [Enterobacter hormaechei]|nr:Uncharacterised protein [Enterobacter hormaechei]
MNKAHAALIAGGCKTGQIAHNAAAQGKQCCITTVRFLQKCGKDGIQYRQAFVLLAIGQNHTVDLHARLLKQVTYTVEIKRSQRLVGDQHRLITRFQW